MQIAGARIVLRDLRLDDLPALEQWFQPGHEWRAFDGPYFAQPTVEKVAEQIASLRRRVEAGEFPDPREVDGVRYDGIAYGVLREEWEARYPGGFTA